MSQFAVELDDLIHRAVLDIMRQSELEKDVSYIASETLGEVIEKLVILHIRIWNLEDVAGKATQERDMDLLTKLHIKLDECDKVIRPRLMGAMGQLLKEAVLRNRMELLGAKDVKWFEGFTE